jgi:hypothetical protein
MNDKTELAPGIAPGMTAKQEARDHAELWLRTYLEPDLRRVVEAAFLERLEELGVGDLDAERLALNAAERWAESEAETRAEAIMDQADEAVAEFDATEVAEAQFPDRDEDEEGGAA